MSAPAQLNTASSSLTLERLINIDVLSPPRPEEPICIVNCSTGYASRSIVAKSFIPKGTLLYDKPVDYFLTDRPIAPSDFNYTKMINIASDYSESRDEEPNTAPCTDFKHRGWQMTAFLMHKLSPAQLKFMFHIPEDFKPPKVLAKDAERKFLLVLRNTYKDANKTPQCSPRYIQAFERYLSHYLIHLPGSFMFQEDIKHSIFQSSWISLIDHSCEPNILFQLDEEEVEDMYNPLDSKINYRLRVFSIRDIPAGHQLGRAYTMSVQENLNPIISRHMQLRRHSLVQTCMCDLCLTQKQKCKQEELRFLDRDGRNFKRFPDGHWDALDANIPLRPFPRTEHYPNILSQHNINFMESLFSTIRNCTGQTKSLYVRRLTILQWFVLYFSAFEATALEGTSPKDLAKLKFHRSNDSEMFTHESNNELQTAFRTFPIVFESIPSTNVSMRSTLPPVESFASRGRVMKPNGFSRWPYLILRNFANFFRMILLHDWSQLSTAFLKHLETFLFMMCSSLSQSRNPDPIVACQISLLDALVQRWIQKESLKANAQSACDEIRRERKVEKDKAVAATAQAAAAPAAGLESVSQQPHQEVPSDSSTDEQDSKPKKGSDEFVLSQFFVDLWIDLQLKKIRLQPTLERMRISGPILKAYHDTLKIVHPSVRPCLVNLVSENDVDLASFSEIEDQSKSSRSVYEKLGTVAVSEPTEEEAEKEKEETTFKEPYPHTPMEEA